MDADEMPANAGDERTLGGHCPRFDVGLEEVGVLLEVLRRRRLAPLAREGSGTDQRGNVGRERRGRVTAILLPAILGSGRTVPDEVARRLQYHRKWVEILEGFGLVQAPGEHDRESGLVQ